MPRQKSVFQRQRNYARGVLVTSLHMPGSLKEAMALLQPYVGVPDEEEKDKADEVENPPNNKRKFTGDVEEQLKKRKLDKSKMTPDSKFWKGAGFIQFASNTLSPNLVVGAAMDDLIIRGDQQPKRKFHTKFLQRLLPVEISCSPHQPQFRKAARALVAAYFPMGAINVTPEKFPEGEEEEEKNGTTVEQEQQEETPLDEGCTEKAKYTPVVSPAFQVPDGATWRCIFNARTGMTTIPRADAIGFIGELVGVNYKVNLTAAEYVVIVEINKNFCGLSVVHKYFERQLLNFGRATYPKRPPL